MFKKLAQGIAFLGASALAPENFAPENLSSGNPPDNPEADFEYGQLIRNISDRVGTAIITVSAASVLPSLPLRASLPKAASLSGVASSSELAPDTRPLNLIIVGDVSGSFSDLERPDVIKKMQKLLDVVDPKRDSLQAFIMGAPRIPKTSRFRFGREEMQIAGTGDSPIGERALAEARAVLCKNYFSGHHGQHSDSLWVFRRINENLQQAGVDSRKNALVFFWDGEPDTLDDVDWKRYPELNVLPDEEKIPRYQAMIKIELERLVQAGIGINIVTPADARLPDYIDAASSVVVPASGGDIGFDEFVRILKPDAAIEAGIACPVCPELKCSEVPECPPSVACPSPVPCPPPAVCPELKCPEVPDQMASAKKLSPEERRNRKASILSAVALLMLTASILLMRRHLRKWDKLCDELGEIFKKSL